MVWLGVTFATAPESNATLDAFYRRVRPGGPGWRPVADRLGFAGDPIPGGALSWVNWVAGLVTIYCAVVALGAILTGSSARAGVYAVCSVAAFALIMRNLRADQRYVAGVDRSQGGNLGFSQSN